MTFVNPNDEVDINNPEEASNAGCGVFGRLVFGLVAERVLTLPLRGTPLKCPIARAKINFFPDGGSSRA
jgi:hypothetical protein